jgi:hypothetical protein
MSRLFSAVYQPVHTWLTGFAWNLQFRSLNFDGYGRKRPPLTLEPLSGERH